jgi:hypothetical protein
MLQAPSVYSPHYAVVKGDGYCSRAAIYRDPKTGHGYCKQHAGHPATVMAKASRKIRPGLVPIAMPANPNTPVEMLACPFCGGEGVYIGTFETALMPHVACKNCGAKAFSDSEHRKPYYRAIAQWNTRLAHAKEQAPVVDRYLIRKDGYYYRPNAQGYTASKTEAGRYTLEEAISYTHPNGPDGPRDALSYELDDTPILTAPASSVPDSVMVEALEALVGEEVIYLTGAENPSDEAAIFVTVQDVLNARQALATLSKQD